MSDISGSEPTPELRLWRLRLATLAFGGFGALMLWASWLVLHANIGTHICSDYTFYIGGTNPKLDDWCNGRSWDGWTGAWMVASFAIVLAAWVSARNRHRVWPLAIAILLAGVGVWLGLALPQVASS